ncbi:hypothetical protein ACHAXT_008609 [Thalassiosira profunda]
MVQFALGADDESSSPSQVTEPAGQPAGQHTSFDEAYGQTMATTTAEDDASGAHSDTLNNFSFSLANDTQIQTQLSSFSVGSFSSGTVGSESLDNCTLDSIGHMLIKLDENDASLTDVTIDCKAMDKEAATEIGLYLPDNTRLKRLRLNCGSFPYHREVLREVAKGLQGNTSIVHIQIHNARMNHEMASWLLPCFTHSRTLQGVVLVNCKGSGLEELFVAMQQNKTIEHLTVRSCRWAKYISDIMALSLPMMNLVSLSLIDVNMPEDCWPYLFRKIGECRELTRLDLSRNRLSQSSIYMLTRGLTAQRLCSTLVLSSCRLGNGCLWELDRGLRDTSLASVDLSKNPNLGDKGAIYLHGLILRNSSITHVRVDGCGFGEESLDDFESGLRYNESIMRNVCSYSVFDLFDFPVPQGRKVISAPATAADCAPATEQRDDSVDGSEIGRMVDEEARLVSQIEKTSTTGPLVLDDILESSL